MTTSNTLLLIDGHSLALRSFFGIYTMAEKTGNHVFVRSDGQHTEAVHAFLSTLLNIIKEHQPSHIAVAFDLPGGTFRTAEYGEYKGGRNAIPEAFSGQIELIQQMLAALNIPALTKENYEADDIVATLATRGAASDYKVLILSGDRDIFQLVTDDITLLYPVTTGPAKGIQIMDPAAVLKKTKVTPELYPDLAALTGEQADNLPGVPGVGPGFAAKWLNEYGSLDGVLANADKITGKKGEALRENMDAVRRNRRLNALVRDLDVDVTLEDTFFNPDLAALESFFDVVEFRSMRKRAAETLTPLVRQIAKKLGESEGSQARSEGTLFDMEPVSAEKPASSYSGPGFEPISTQPAVPLESVEQLHEWLAAATAARYGKDSAGNELETPERIAGAVTLYPLTQMPIARAEGKNLEGKRVTKVAIRAAEEAPKLQGIILTAHMPADSDQPGSIYCDPALVDPELLGALATWCADENARKIVLDLKSVRKLLGVNGLELNGAVEDPALSSYMCGFIPKATRRLLIERLEDMAAQYLWMGADEFTESMLINTEVPNLQVNVQFSRLVHELARVLHYDMVEQGQLGVYTEIELPLLLVLADMERAGIAVSAELLEELEATFTARAEDAVAAARAIVGPTVTVEEKGQMVESELNLASVTQLQYVLFELLKLPTTRKMKTGYSTDSESMTELLAQISPESDGALFIAALGHYRDNIKLKQTVEGLIKASEEDGRVHTTFQQAAASTGRLSSTNPNLQNIPVRTEEGRRIRGAFISAPKPVDGVVYEGLLTADYSQIEMRIMVHLAGDKALIDAYAQGEDLHRFVGSQVFGVAPEDVTSDMRAKVKAMSYGLAYGLSRFGLSKQLNISAEEAGQLRTDYFKRFGRVGRFLRNVVKQAHQDGYTETMFGRRRMLPDLESTNRMRRESAERAALNAPIQGAAADLMKIAMINIHRRLLAEGLATRMLLQVHDEIILEVAAGERESAEKILIEEMSGAADLSVPLEVQCGWGASWQEAAH